MENFSEFKFPGQQEGEKIISEIKPHKWVLMAEYIKVVGVSLLLFIGFIFLGEISKVFVVIAVVISILTLIIGLLLCYFLYIKRVTYITDRRIIRFEPTNIFVVQPRFLTWDNILKTKTISKSLFWRLVNVGDVIVHSKTTSTGDNNPNQVLIGNDDIIMKGIYFFKDLGNYIDKITYIYNCNRDELKTVKQFIAKRKGQRE